MATFEQEVLKKIIGEDAFHEVLIGMGGLKFHIPRPNTETVRWLYNSGKTTKEIVIITKLSESRVRRILKMKR